MGQVDKTIGVPEAILQTMLLRQQQQGNCRSILVFRSNLFANKPSGGFTWDETPEGHPFWHEVLVDRSFNLFFKTNLPKISKSYKVW